MNTYYLKIINDFIIENKIADKNKKQCIQNSSMAIFPKSKNNINNDISRIDSGLNNNINLVKLESFFKINSSISNKIFPIQFSNKETKDIFLFYKELVNQRLNIINILKKLEIIQIPDIKKSLSNNTINNIKLINSRYNNYINEN